MRFEIHVFEIYIYIWFIQSDLSVLYELVVLVKGWNNASIKVI